MSRCSAAIALLVTLVGGRLAHAQVADSSRARARADSVAPKVPVARIPSRLSPPISPRRAFLYSLVLPGFGQSRLDRGTSGALFSSIELAALVMVRRSKADLREVNRYRIDTLPATFAVVNGVFRATGTTTNRFTPDLERTRRLHVEDWLAVLAFNHLFCAADAFVAAQLWDVPVTLSATPRRDGAMIMATLRW